MKINISKVLLLVIISGILILGGSSYAAASFYQSKKLVEKGDGLFVEGKYEEASSNFDKAKKKWPWAKTDTKKAQANDLKKLKQYADEGEGNFGKGEWQKCLENLGEVDSRFPKYNEVQARYSDCEKKLTEQKAVEAVTSAASNNPAPQTQPAKSQTSTKSTASAAATKTSENTTGPTAPIDETANWVTYTNAFYHFSFKHPADTQVTAEERTFSEMAGAYYQPITIGSTTLFVSDATEAQTVAGLVSAHDIPEYANLTIGGRSAKKFLSGSAAAYVTFDPSSNKYEFYTESVSVLTELEKILSTFHFS